MTITGTVLKKIVIGAYTALVLFVITAGAIGLYAVRSSSIDTARYIEAVDIARRVQVDFQKQFYLWNNLVIRGENFSEFKENYHSFSYHSDRVRDSLFNLKMLCLSLGIPTSDAENMIAFHNSLSGEYIAGLNKLERDKFRNRAAVLSQTRGKDEEAVKMMDDLVARIETASEDKVSGIHDYYIKVAIITFVIISLLLAIMSIYIARIVLTAQKKLEDKVLERTFELAESNVRLLGKNEELEALNKKISISEERYRMLVEGSNSIIFTLDENLNIVSCSKAVSRYLRIKQDAVIGRYFMDLMSDGKDGEAAEKRIIIEKLTGFRTKMEPVSFRMNFKTSLNSEPIEMDVRLEYLEISGKNEILGIASKEAVDSLIGYFVSENKKYSIGNYLTTADEVSHRATKNLSRFLDSREANLVMVSLREMIINSIEHGNLGIDFKEKTLAQENESYFTLLAEKQNDPVLSEKRIKVEYSINRERAVYKITDEGNGFDHVKYMNTNSNTADQSLAHGRGIIMAQSIFDEIRYNNSGNQVLLTKKFR